ncbi:hypothetical protein PPTG_14147 [Phytophthora nicotianae INRA-310]|uniref:Uncharacterized protein n=2 Tax=Phytophthora nicotianae TaxID=4792 RepID=W2PWY9_PHYN3|nr:hypothetical protein PPTG_14147 [Phytophthora nicotianae INRA-310]ETN05407.1 hypothetical protein PPTG_14147 [Phytophthora nicotianae INRA-310]KUF86218.1 hypothetical protein AM587_10017302 [Phytophthora nicotianae]
MKRRTFPTATPVDPRRSRLGSSTRLSTRTQTTRNPVKKTTKKRPSRDVASSILGLKKTEPSSHSRTNWSSDESNALDHIAECQCLREQLERVLIDHQRQEEEIVALRALAKSLAEEVEAIHQRQQLRSSMCSSDNIVHREDQHFDIFKLNVQVEELQGENTELRRQLAHSTEELKSSRACIAEKLPVYKLAAVKANAELRCVKSQLQKERAHSDLLQKQLVRCKARQDDVPVRVALVRGNNQEEDDEDPQESEVVRREREEFLRQCMCRQDSRASISPERKQSKKKPSEADDSEFSVELDKPNNEYLQD